MSTSDAIITIVHIGVIVLGLVLVFHLLRNKERLLSAAAFLVVAFLSLKWRLSHFVICTAMDMLLAGGAAFWLLSALLPRDSFILYKGRKIRLIGISGKIGAGKTTLANHLCNRYPFTLKRVSFAENLRRMVAILIHIDVEKTRSTHDKAVKPPGWDCTVGDLLQRFGTEVGRQIHADAWVLSLFAGFDESSFWVSDDVRFKNEAKGIKERGGLLIRLNGDPGKVYEEAGKVRNLNHVSETELDDYDGFDVILNAEEYRNNVEGLYNAIFSQ